MAVTEALISAFPEKPVSAHLSLTMPTLVPQATQAAHAPTQNSHSPCWGEAFCDCLKWCLCCLNSLWLKKKATSETEGLR